GSALCSEPMSGTVDEVRLQPHTGAWAFRRNLLGSQRFCDHGCTLGEQSRRWMSGIRFDFRYPLVRLRAFGVLAGHFQKSWRIFRRLILSVRCVGGSEGCKDSSLPTTAWKAPFSIY